MHLLYSSIHEGWGFFFLFIVLIIPALTVLFSAACLLSSRGRLKWAALILTALLTVLELTLLKKLGDRATASAGIIPLICLTMIVTRFWLLAGRPWYWLLSVIWIVLMQATLGHLVGRYFESMSAGSGLLSARTLPLVWKICVAGFSGVKLLEGAARRNVQAPGAGGFVLLIIAVVFAGAALMQAVTGSLFDAIRTRTGFEQPDIYKQSIDLMITGAVAATFARLFVRYRSYRREP